VAEPQASSSAVQAGFGADGGIGNQNFRLGRKKMQ